MPTPPIKDTALPSAAAINTRIRALCAGRVVWTPEARRELAWLTGEWRDATAREQLAAAA